MELGSILLILTLVSGSFIIVITPFTKKIANNYFLWMIIGLFIFLYVFFARQIQYLMPQYTNNTNDSNGLRLSRILLLDLCPFYAIFGSLSLLLKNKSMAKIMAPFGLFGAMVTIFGQIIHDANGVLPNNYWQYIFVGDNVNQLYFMMHYLSFLMSLMIICWMKNWRIKIFGYMHVFALAYFGYILIVVAINADITSNTTGILENDWINGGEYSGVADFLGIKNYPMVMIVGYILSYIAIILIFWLKFGTEKLFNWLSKKYNFLLYKERFLSHFKKDRKLV